ncbi:unnamed protein product [Staurois parvus]|uniref:Cytochrome P450 n=1 Tax=Staurois parvus TaxID=386267 RepID=A0ABN9AX08_9NEOB|nr:unnamed protein product [Staurois parvus]
MGFSTILALLVTVLITLHFIISWWKQHIRYRSLPPGPTPLPFLGNPKYMDLRTADKNYTLAQPKVRLGVHHLETDGAGGGPLWL